MSIRPVPDHVISPTAADVEVMGFGGDSPAPGTAPSLLKKFEIRL